LAPTQVFWGMLREEKGSNFYGFMGYRCPGQHLITLHGGREYLDIENVVRARVTVGKGNECDP